MIEKQAAMTMIQESLDSLFRSGTLNVQLTADEGLVLMGGGSEERLDSLGFVNFIMDLEERLEDAIGNEAPITLTEIDGFDVNNPILTTSTLADYMVKIAGNS
tara:strand:+ start:304 stop:612 length:309 start_codon:yes stop_codon:yes gene_type:complete